MSDVDSPAYTVEVEEGGIALAYSQPEPNPSPHDLPASPEATDQDDLENDEVIHSSPPTTRNYKRAAFLASLFALVVIIALSASLSRRTGSNNINSAGPSVMIAQQKKVDGDKAKPPKQAAAPKKEDKLDASNAVEPPKPAPPKKEDVVVVDASDADVVEPSKTAPPPKKGDKVDANDVVAPPKPAPEENFASSLLPTIGETDMVSTEVPTIGATLTVSTEVTAPPTLSERIESPTWKG